MATVSFQFTSVAETGVTATLNQQGSPAQPAAKPNQTAAAPQDTVTISRPIPLDPLVPLLFGLGQDYSYSGEVNTGGNTNGNNTAAGNNQTQAPAAPPTLPPNPPVTVGAPASAAVNVPALNPPGTDDATAANTTTNAAAAAQATPDQELAQLDQTLQQLGIEPQSISLFNRMAMLLYAQDPAAVKNLVDALQTADQQLGQLAGLANSTAAANQPAAQTAQDLAQLLPTAQAQTQAQNTAAANNFEIVAAQLNFTEIQGTLTTEGAGNNGSGGAAAQPAQTTAQFEELQLSFAALEVQGTEATQNTTQNTNAQGPALNVST